MEWAKSQQHLHILPPHWQTVVKTLCTYDMTSHKCHIRRQCSVIYVSKSGDLIACPFYVSSSVLAGSFCCNTPPESESNMNRLGGIKLRRWTNLNNLLWVMRAVQNHHNHNHPHRHCHWSGFIGSCMLRKESHLWQAHWRLDSHHNHDNDGACSRTVFKMDKMVFIAEMLTSKPDLTHPYK